MSIIIPPESEEQIAALAALSGRAPEAIVVDAIRHYVEREAETIAKIRAGMAEAASRGETIAHDDVMSELEAIIDAASQIRAGTPLTSTMRSVLSSVSLVL
jgi:predicted transcriptional regulator